MKRLILPPRLSLADFISARHGALICAGRCEDYRAAHEAAIVGQLGRIDPPAKRGGRSGQGLAATAARLESLLKARGFKTASLVRAGGRRLSVYRRSTKVPAPSAPSSFMPIMTASRSRPRNGVPIPLCR